MENYIRYSIGYILSLFRSIKDIGTRKTFSTLIKAVLQPPLVAFPVMTSFNGRESIINRSLDGNIYSGEKLVPFSLKFFVRCLEIQQLILEIGITI